MSSWAAEHRRQQAAWRREERASRRRQKELERLIKERTKLSELEQARLDVEVHENAIEELLSVHREQSERINWPRLASALPPHAPAQIGRHEFAALLAQGIAPRPATVHGNDATVEEAHLNDEEAHRQAQADHQSRIAEQQRLQALAKRVLAGQPQAYSEAIAEFSPFEGIAALGSSIHLTVHGPKLIGCVLTVHGREVIPAEAKSLTAAGKLSVRPMPRERFHEIYQDYVCGCALRVARELLALLPVDTVLVTASVDGIDSRTGSRADLPVLSVAFDRVAVERLSFERLDPSDAMENFVHRGDAKTSRKSGEFIPVVPLDLEDGVFAQLELQDLSKLLTGARQLRAEIVSKIVPQTQPAEPAGQTLLST
ncbi:MAG: hypothetical protein INR62_04615 [Rhodospirillales bacterium]|nr:hypothetical protein [Acetobacter sp.]